MTPEARAELRARMQQLVNHYGPGTFPYQEVAAGQTLALLDALDAAEAENERLREQRDAKQREMQAAVRKAFEEGQQVERERAETAEATIARLTAEVTEGEAGAAFSAMAAGPDVWEVQDVLTAFIEGRKGDDHGR
jgi:hypothetical protein